MARYRKIDTRIWNDQKFNGLSEDGKLVFFLLLTHPHLTSIGAFRASAHGLASELRWPYARFSKAFTECLQNQMIQYDQSASLIWLPNYLKYNQPESPNVVRAWEHTLDYLPECSMKEVILKVCHHFAKQLGAPFSEALPKAFRKGMANQEQEQEQKQEKKKKDIMSGKPDVPSKKINFKKTNPHIKNQAVEILKFLNEKADRNYRYVDTNLKFIIARLQSGASVRDCYQVIAKKTRQWKEDPKMSLYLRPATLFNATKFEQYRGELVIAKQGE